VKGLNKHRSIAAQWSKTSALALSGAGSRHQRDVNAYAMPCLPIRSISPTDISMMWLKIVAVPSIKIAQAS